MAGRGVINLGFTLVLLVFTILQHVSSDDKCRSGCQGQSQIFKYVEGTTYNYNLDGNIDITLSNAEGQQSSTKLKATVSLTQLPQCNQLLKLNNVQVIGPDAKKYNNIAGIEKPIRLNFHDGHVEDSICAEPGDNQNSLNIKRAVASIFQAATKQQYETDVFGLCPTEIITNKEGNNVIIHKTRSLNKCAHRESIKQDFMATAFNLNSEIKSSPILNGEYSSEQRIKNGILDHAAVLETYLYVPFSVGKNGVKATVNTKLHYTGSSKAVPTSKVSVPKSIIFENPHLVNAQESNVDSILSALKETKNTIDITVGEKTAKDFVNLIKILRASKKDDILSVYGQVRHGAGFNDKVGAKKVFLDAVFRAGTGDTIEVGIELLKNKELDAVQQKLFYLSLAFVKHATLSSLSSATVLLDLPNLPREGFLGVGTLAGRYCKEHSCKNEDAVNKLTQKLLSKLGDGKSKNRQHENEIVAVLKGLANIEHLNDGVLSKIISIAQDKKSPIRVRVAALETLQVEACKDKVRDSGLNVLKDIQQDSEIRIKAYLLIAQCPNGKVANSLKTILDNEPSYQVGGFITSHLRNLKASANPDKEFAKHHLSQIYTSKKFPIDIRKYSFNNEFSYTVDTLGLANSVESNLIYSQNSFLPRSTNLNLTAQLFGHTFNFLEVGTRQENLDRVFEHYFGPLGVLGKATPEELLESGKASIDKIVNHFTQRLSKTRGKRDISKGEIDSIAKQVQIKTNELNTDLDLDLSVKVFGSELLFLSVNDQNQKFSPDSIIDKIFDCLDESIAKAKNFEKTIQSNDLFLDSEFSYPTSIGFPLRLAVEGSSSVQLKVAGKVDLQALINSEFGSSPLKLSLIPSANIDVHGSLIVDAQVVQGGLKVSSSLYTATGGDIEVVHTNDGNGLDVKFSLPVQNQKLISATHEIVFNVRELGKPEVSQPIKFGQNKDFSVCIDQLSPFIGLAFCADINSPPVSAKHGVILPFPLSGNAKFAVGIEREDLSHIHLSKLVQNTESAVGAQFTIETIGEKNNKKLGLQLEAQLIPEAYIKASVVSAVIQASAEARVIDNEKEKSLSVILKQDTKQISGKIGVLVSGNPAQSIYTPLLQYDGPQEGKFPFKVEGRIIAEQSGPNVKYTFDNVRLVSENPAQKPFSVQGNLGRESGGLFTDLTLSDGTNSGSLKGKVQIQQNFLKLNAELKNTYNPHVNVNVKYEYKRQQHQVESNLLVIHGQDLSSKTNKLSVSNVMSVVPFDGYVEVDTRNKITYPALNFESTLDFVSKPNLLKYDVEFQYINLKVGSELDAKVNYKTKGDHDVEFEIYGFDNKLEIKSKREITGDKSKIEKAIAINGNKLEVTGIVKHHYKPEDVDVGLDLLVKIPGRTEPFKVQSGLVLNPDELDHHLKVSSGSNVYVDSFVKGTKGGNANGSLKVSLKDILNANGQLRVTNGVGTATVMFDLVRFNRKIKAESSFTYAEPTYNLLFTLYPNYEKDNNNKFVITTNNQIKPNHVDSQNKIEFLAKVLEFNFKGHLEGKMDDGKFTNEIEIILPTNLYLAFKLNRELHIVNNAANGNVLVTFEQRPNKNTPGSKVTLTGNLKNGDVKKRFFDLTYNLVAENGHGKILNADLVLKRLLEGEQTVVDIIAKASGSLLSSPMEFNANALYKGFVGSYNIKSKCSSDATLDVKGNYDFDMEDNEVLNEVNVQLTTPSASIRVLRFIGSAYGKSEQEQLKLKGSYQLFVDDDGSNPEATVDSKVDLEATIGPHSGQYKTTVNLQKEDPVVVDLAYNVAEEGEVKTLSGRLGVDYSKNKFVKSAITLVRPAEHEYNLDFKVSSSETSETGLQVHTKRSNEDKLINSEITLTSNNQKFVLTNELNLAKTSPSVNLKLVLPNGKIDQIYVQLTGASEKQFGGNFKLLFGENDFLFESNFDANIESIDNFDVKSTINSPALKIDNLVVEALNQPSKSGKRIQVTATLAGQNLLSGSTSYKARQEGDKYIVEGSGSFKVKEENKQANFKFIRQALTSARHGEDGVEVSFNAGLGSKAYDSELKITNKQFRVLNSYCEEKKQCAHIEVDAKTNTLSAGEFNQEIEVAVDLRKLGLSHEFGLRGLTTRKNFVLDHTVDIYFQSKDNKYQYSLYVHPNEAGAQLTTPKRIIALESNYHVENKQGNFKPVTGEIVLYLDKKNQPTQKTSLSATMNCNTVSPSGDCVANVKFTNPTLGKDLSVSYECKFDHSKKTSEFNLVIDVFPNPNQKIIVSGKGHANNIGTDAIGAVGIIEVKSEGMKVNAKWEEQFYVDIAKREIKYSYEVIANIVDKSFDSGLIATFNPQQASVLLKLLNKGIIDVNSKIQRSDKKLVVITDYNVLGLEPSVDQLDISNYNTLSYVYYEKSNPNDKYQVKSHVIFGDSAELDIAVIVGGQTHKLLNNKVSLSEQTFLKCSHEINTENIKKYFYSYLKEDVQKFNAALTSFIESGSQDLKAQVQKVVTLVQSNVPNFKPLKEYYRGELQKLREELVSDKTIEKISQLLKSVFGAFAHAANEFFLQVSEITEKIVEAAQKQISKTIDIVNNKIVPKLSEFAKKVITSAASLLEQATDIVITIVAKINSYIEAHQNELKQISNTIFAVTQDFGRFLYKLIDQTRNIVTKEWRTLYDEIKRLPIAEDFKDKYEQLFQGSTIPDTVINGFKEIVATLKDALPSEDLKKIVTIIGDYIEKKLKGENVDDIASLQKVAEATVAFIKKLVQTFSGNKDVHLSDKTLPLSLDFIQHLPKLAAIKFSPFSYAKNRDYPSLSQFLNSLSLNPKDWVPPYKLDAVIAQGQHIFTFDGKHLTFPGNCNYLLSRDAVNGNFTIAGTYSNGLLTAIVYADKYDVVTLKKDGHVVINNAATELPIHKKQVAVHRSYESVTIDSKAGVKITCGPELFVCGIHVSGFYHGQLKGLLGNGNNEAYDDYTLPNGKIVPSEAEFGNSYKLSGSCPVVKTTDHHVHAHNPICKKLFAYDSPLSLCYKFVDPENYKIACDHGLAANVQDTEKAIAVAYVASCNAKYVPVYVPSEYVKCTNSEQQYSVGETFSTKTPAKAADIVFVVDLAKSNEVIYKELVQPVITQLTTELSSKGVNDIEYHIVGYGGEYGHFAHYTVAGKLTFKGRSPALKFAEPHQQARVSTGCPHMDDFIEMIKESYEDLGLVLGYTTQEASYSEAFKFPFRAHALKSIVGVTSRPCKVGKLLLLQKIRTLLFSEKQISVNLITPVDNFAVKDAKQTKNVIGFDAHNVFTFSDAKKKPEGTSDLHSELEYDDYCIDFTLKSRGNVYVANNFLQAKGASKKQFVQTTAHNIASKLLKVEFGLDCECQMSTPYSAQNVCEVAYSKHKKDSGKKGGHKG